MTTKYQCDVTGEQYEDESKVEEVGIYTESAGTLTTLDVGPDADPEEVREILITRLDGLIPQHPERFDDE